MTKRSQRAEAIQFRNRRMTGWIAGVSQSLGSCVRETHRALDPAIQVRVLAPQLFWMSQEHNRSRRQER